MSPVEPRPEVIGTIGFPSGEGRGLCFLPSGIAAFEPEGVKRPPVIAPRAVRKERRVQSNLKFTDDLLFQSRSEASRNYFSDAAGGLTTRAAPTTSMSE